MITFIIDMIYNFLSWVISLFPTGDGFPSAFHTAVSELGSYIGILEPLVPFSIMASCLAIIFTAEIAMFGFKTFKWVFSHVPLVGGKG